MVHLYSQYLELLCYINILLYGALIVTGHLTENYRIASYVELKLIKFLYRLYMYFFHFIAYIIILLKKTF